MDETDFSFSAKAKEYLTRKLDELQNKVIKLENKVIKLKHKRKIINMLYYSSVILSMSLSGIITTLSSFTELPTYIIPIMSTTSGILTGLSAKLNLESKKVEINNLIDAHNNLIDKLNKLQSKLDYVVSCNGNLTKEEYEKNSKKV